MYARLDYPPNPESKFNHVKCNILTIYPRHSTNIDKLNAVIICNLICNKLLNTQRLHIISVTKLSSLVVDTLLPRK